MVILKTEVMLELSSEQLIGVHKIGKRAFYGERKLWIKIRTGKRA